MKTPPLDRTILIMDMRRSLQRLRRELSEFRQERADLDSDCQRATRKINALKLAASEMEIDLEPR